MTATTPTISYVASGTPEGGSQIVTLNTNPVISWTTNADLIWTTAATINWLGSFAITADISKSPVNGIPKISFTGTVEP